MLLLTPRYTLYIVHCRPNFNVPRRPRGQSKASTYASSYNGGADTVVVKSAGMEALLMAAGAGTDAGAGGSAAAKPRAKSVTTLSFPAGCVCVCTGHAGGRRTPPGALLRCVARMPCFLTVLAGLLSFMLTCPPC